MARVALLDPAERRVATEHCLSVIGASSPIERVVDLARGALDDARASGNVFEVIEALSVLRRAQLSAADVWPARRRHGSTRTWCVGAHPPVHGGGRTAAGHDGAAARVDSPKRRSTPPRPCRCSRIPSSWRGSRCSSSRCASSRVASTRCARPWRGGRPRTRRRMGASVWRTARRAGRAGARQPHPRAAGRRRGFDAVPRDELFFLSLCVAAWTVVLLGDRDGGGALRAALALTRRGWWWRRKARCAGARSTASSGR